MSGYHNCIMNNTWRAFICFNILSLFISSCTSNKNIAYFKDFADTAKKTAVKLPVFSYPHIQRDDILNITIQTIDPETNAVLNTPTTFTPAAVVGSANAGGQSL